MITCIASLGRVIFNTSPVDAGYVEFTKVVDNGTMVYTQHALDRYNERAHADKYENHRDIIKRLIVNNPTKVDAIRHEPTGRLVLRINEGFLVGKYDTLHSCMIINTFYDSEDYTDNRVAAKARSEFNKIAELTPPQLKKYYQINGQFHSGEISKDEFDYLLYINGIDIN